MFRFRVTYIDRFGGQQTQAISAADFRAAAKQCQQSNENSRVLKVFLLEPAIQVKLRCGQCGRTDQYLARFEDDLGSSLPCKSCQNFLWVPRTYQAPLTRPDRQRKPKPNGKSELSDLKHQETFGEHTRQPSAADQLKAVTESIEVVRFSCRHCADRLECRFVERFDQHECPTCGTMQHVNPSAWAWNSRIKNETMRKESARRLREVENAKEVEAARIRAQRRAEEQAERARHEAAQRRIAIQLHVFQLASVTGILAVRSPDELSDKDCEYATQIERLADEYASDIELALRQNVDADRAVAYGRPASIAGGLFAASRGHPFIGLGLAAFAVGARALSNDWKQMKASEYQLKWHRIMQQLGNEGTADLMRVLAYKHPASVPALSSGGG